VATFILFFNESNSVKKVASNFRTDVFYLSLFKNPGYFSEYRRKIPEYRSQDKELRMFL
jgi:hypothetical protein